MTKEESTLLHRLETQVRFLLQRYKALEDINHTLQARNEQLSQKIVEAQQETVTLREELAQLKLAKMLSITDSDITDTRGRVNKLIREIDKCIALLNL